MADINSTDWTEADSGNTTAPPDGWPEGQPANSVNNCARAMMGATKRWYDHINATATSTGSANAQVVTYTVPPTALVKGDRYAFIAGFINTGATTLNVGVGGAVAIKSGATDLAPASIITGDVVEVAYDGSIFQFIGWDPARVVGQDLTVHSLTTTSASASAINSGGGVQSAGPILAGTTLTVGTNETIVGNYLYLANSTGTVNSTGGNFIYGDGNNAVWHLPNNAGALLVQNQAGTNVHTLSANGNASHTGTLAVTGAATLSSTLAVTGAATLSSTLAVSSSISAGSIISSTGSNAAVGFANRAGGGADWLWYATSGTARLWNGADRFLVDASGNASVTGAITVSGGGTLTGTYNTNTINANTLNANSGGNAIVASGGNIVAAGSVTAGAAGISTTGNIAASGGISSTTSLSTTNFIVDNAGALTTNGTVTVGGNVVVTGGVGSTTSLSTTNFIVDNAGTLTTNGTATVGGNVVVGNDITVNGGAITIGTVLLSLGGGGVLAIGASFEPSVDNVHLCGSGGNAWNNVVSYAFTNVSDLTLKTDIADLPSCLALVEAIDPHRYRWIDGQDTERTHWGFVAQEVGEAMNAAGHDFGGHVVDDGRHTLAYSEMVAVSWKAIQELTERNAALEARLAALEAK